MASEIESNDSISEIWQRIPPEERLEVLASAQARGIQACLLLLIMTGSAALGLRVPWIFFGSFLLLQLVFQIATAKAWHILKPRSMLEYITARSTARIYASFAQARDLDLSIILRGELEPVSSAETIEGPLDTTLESPSPVPVWVSLFPDTMVIASESPSGAILELSHSILNNFTISAEGFDLSEGGTRRLIIEIEGHPGKISKWHLTGPHPSALLACERRAHGFIAKHKKTVDAKGLTHQRKTAPLGLSAALA